jgi:hypothetical protein
MNRQFSKPAAGFSTQVLAAVAAIVMLATHATAEKVPPVKFSQAATDILVNPADVFPDMSDVVSGNASFAVTGEHIVLLRKLRFGLETAQTGAPMVDPDPSYATPDLIAAIGDITGATIEVNGARQNNFGLLYGRC